MRPSRLSRTNSNTGAIPEATIRKFRTTRNGAKTHLFVRLPLTIYVYGFETVYYAIRAKNVLDTGRVSLSGDADGTRSDACYFGGVKKMSDTGSDLQRVIKMITDEDWSGMDVDIKGAIYEGCARGGRPRFFLARLDLGVFPL